MADQKAVIATTVIYRTIKPGMRGDASKGIAPTKPEVQIVKTGTRFVPKDKAEYDELLKAGAIKLPSEPAASVAEVEAEAKAAETTEPKKTRRGKQPKQVDENDLV